MHKVCEPDIRARLGSAAQPKALTPQPSNRMSMQMPGQMPMQGSAMMHRVNGHSLRVLFKTLINPKP